MDQLLRDMGEHLHGLIRGCEAFTKGLTDMKAKVDGLEKAHKEAEEVGERLGQLNEQCAALQMKKDGLERDIAGLLKKHGLGG